MLLPKGRQSKQGPDPADDALARPPPTARGRPPARPFLRSAISPDTPCSDLLRPAPRPLDDHRASRTRAGPPRLAVRPGDQFPALLDRAAHLVGDRHIVELLGHLAA